MTQNILQDFLLLAFMTTCVWVLWRDRKIRLGLIIRENSKQLCSGTQGIETTIGRSRGADLRFKEPAVSRKHAVLHYDAKSGVVRAWTKHGEQSSAQNAVPNHTLQFSLPKAENPFEYRTLVVILAIAFIGLRAIAMYAEFQTGIVLLPFCILLAYIAAASAIRADHQPIIESVFCVLLTYYIDATLYFGADAAAIRDTILGIGIYVVGAFAMYCFLLLDLSKVHSPLRVFACIIIGCLIALNLVFANEVNGAYNWISFGGISFQPSEPIKLLLAFVLISPTRKSASSFQNFLYMVLVPAVCFSYALLIKDVGSLLQFGVLFFAAIFLQSDNILFTIALLIGAILGCKLVLEVSATAASRLLGWRGTETSIWDALTGSGVLQSPYGYGYQPVHCLVAGFKAGGLFGNGGAYDALSGVLAANSDLVTAMLGQKHGTIFLFLLPSLYLLLITATFFSLRQKNRLQQVFSILGLSLILFAFLLNMGGSFGIIALSGVVNPCLSDGISAAMVYGPIFGVLASSGINKNYIKTLKGGLDNDKNLYPSYAA